MFMLAKSKGRLEEFLQIRTDLEADDGPNIYRVERQVSHDLPAVRAGSNFSAAMSLDGRQLPITTK